MFTATLTVGDLDFEKPEDAAIALLSLADNARPLSVALLDQNTGEKHLVTVESYPIPVENEGGLSTVVGFLEGFEGDELQEGIPEMIAVAKGADEALRNIIASSDAGDHGSLMNAILGAKKLVTEAEGQ